MHSVLMSDFSAVMDLFMYRALQAGQERVKHNVWKYFNPFKMAKLNVLDTNWTDRILSTY